MTELQRTPEVAKQVAKQATGGSVLTGVRRWERRVFRPWWTRNGERHEAEQYSVRIAHAGRRETIALRTPDRREAARRAERFYSILGLNGWAAAFDSLGPEPARLKAERAGVTVGELIAAAERVAVDIKPTTLRQYGIALRWLAGLVAGIEGDRSRYDYRKGGLQAWRSKVDAVAIAALTPRAVEHAIARYVKARGASGEARRSASSLMRQARGFWSRKLSRLLPFENLPNPFDGLSIGQPRPPRYLPSFNSGDLVLAARTELREGDPQAWLGFLLLLGAGLRKGEADALVWSNVDTEHGTIRVVAGKTVDSVGEVPIADETTTELARLRGLATGLHVLEGDDRPMDPTRRTYRAEGTFNRLAKWLRDHGVIDRKPLHALRKEAGSIINAVAGIHAASRFLRHGDIGVTAQHYADARTRVVVPLAIGGPREAKA